MTAIEGTDVQLNEVDLLVIGSGSGLEVSSLAASQGRSVAVVEQGPFGGTCLNRGCIPSKMLIHCADVMETIRRAHLFGIKARVEGLDWPFIIRRVFDEIDEEARGIEEANRRVPNIRVYQGSCRFVAEKTVEVNGERVRAETVVIAAGTRPGVPQIAGLTEVPYCTSDDVMRLPAQPQRLLVIGGGYVAAELAHFFGALGTDVTMVSRGPLLLRNEDDQIAARFTEIYGGSSCSATPASFELLAGTQESPWSSRPMGRGERSRPMCCCLPPGGCPIPTSWTSARPGPP